MSSAAVVAISSLEETLVRTPPLSPSVDGSHKSILIYVDVSGSVVPMRVMESDSIESVKLRIQNNQGFVVKKQKLVCSGRELARSNSCDRDYGVSDGNVLHLVLRLSELLLINVNTSCGKKLNFHVDRNRDVAYVKRHVSKAKNDLLSDINDQEVLCDGEKLEDERLINDNCKHNNAVIHLFVQKSAKVMAKSIARTTELCIDAPKPNDVDKENKCEKETKENLFVSRKPSDRDSPLQLSKWKFLLDIVVLGED